jgi:hypothetical protein
MLISSADCCSATPQCGQIAQRRGTFPSTFELAPQARRSDKLKPQQSDAGYGPRYRANHQTLAYSCSWPSVS